ncbi:sulfite exporter TauE/SafE family protein [Gryllotalpicola protaetiae]|uniref:Probable membrane transporter protein n=1 Tax=Gryllotalpicola protaetiae TaxID=2419771 RepID=A0A387BFE7_9MICO|nr:sulfite exporter TauE/SafE family protein [Gryllotalpicola protaetiae]AYG02643.1 sulfite exporter TauE/SafE family protein [Gryllotalpicola protaetiae]
MPHTVAVLLLLPAGVVAGIIGTAGGITSLVAYPALLAAGIPPLTANVTNSVALLGSGLSSASRAAPELVGHGETIRRWVPLSVLFSLAGAVLLVVTPGQVFDRIVPFLVLAGSLILLLQPSITRWQEARGHEWRRPAVIGSLGAVTLYNGYFGAGSGILLIALLLFTREPVLHRANAMKNVILVAADLLPAVLFAVVGSVVWPAAISLGIGAVIGGLIGPSVARRVQHDVMRWLIACCGFVLAAWLLLRQE